MAVAPSVGVGTPVNWPRKEPMAVRLAPTMTMSDMGDSVYGPAAKGRDHPIMLPDAALPQTASRRSAGTRSSEVQGEARPADNGASAGAGGPGVSCCLDRKSVV